MADFAEDLLRKGQTTIANLLIQHLNDLQMSSDEFMVYVALTSFEQRGIDFPSSQQLSEALGFSEAAIFQILHRLIEKKFIDLKTVAAHGQQRQQDHYDLMPIYQKLALVVTQKQQAQKQTQRQNATHDLFKQIEVEFGRMLSPIELETVTAWLQEDHYSPELIELALREAVLNQVYSLKYMDRILLSWEKKNIKTKAQVQREKELRDQY